MKKEFRERYLLYCSGLFHPVYEQYKLKDDVKYATQRYCSLKFLSEYSVQPTEPDYDLFECGILDGTKSLEQMIESVIEIKNLHRNNSVSVGDVIKVYHTCERYFYYVDPVGLQQLQTF